jgi:hypothetical protein
MPNDQKKQQQQHIIMIPDARTGTGPADNRTLRVVMADGSTATISEADIVSALATWGNAVWSGTNAPIKIWYDGPALPVTPATVEAQLSHMITKTDSLAKSLGIAGNTSIASVTTDASDASWVPLPTATCNNINVINATGHTVSFRYGSSGETFELIDKASILLPTNGNSDNLQVKRTQGSGALTLKYFVLP